MPKSSPKDRHGKRQSPSQEMGNLMGSATSRRAWGGVMTIIDLAKQEGKREGWAETVLGELEMRFGPLSAEVKARVLSADMALLKAWTKRLVTAPTLEDLFAQEGANNPAAPRPAARKPARRTAKAPARR